MKRFIVVCAMFLGLLLVAPVWSHHAAEGIVSDDIWTMVDDLLEGSPHLDMEIDLDAVMLSMDVTTDPGYLALSSSAEVETDMVDLYLLVVNAIAYASNRIPSGDTNGDSADTLEIIQEDLGGGITLITMYEPIGNGSSQVAPEPDMAGNRRR